MSRENVEIVRRVYDAVGRRDAAAVLALYDPEVEFDPTRGPVRALMGGPSVYHGHEGLRSWFREWYEAWGNVESSLEELIDTGEHVISVINYRGRGRASGIDVEIARMAGVWTIRDGKVVRVAWFETREEALEASGAAGNMTEGSGAGGALGAAAPASARENTDTARQVFEAVARLDLERLRELTTLDVEWRSFFAAMSGAGEYQGHEGLGDYVRDLGESMMLSPTPDGMVEAGDFVLAVGRIRYRGKESGVEGDTPTGWLFGFRDGRVARFVAFKDPETALETLWQTDARGLPIGPAFDAFQRLDADALVALCDPEVRFESRITAVEDATYQGHEGIRRYIANLAQAFDWIEIERSDIIEDRDRAVFTQSLRARGRGSGVEVEQRFFVAVRGRAGTLLWWGFFDSRSEALEAAGLRE